MLLDVPLPPYKGLVLLNSLHGPAWILLRLLTVLSSLPVSLLFGASAVFFCTKSHMSKSIYFLNGQSGLSHKLRLYQI